MDVVDKVSPIHLKTDVQHAFVKMVILKLEIMHLDSLYAVTSTMLSIRKH